MFIGSYTDGKPNSGLYVYSFDVQTGEVEKMSAVQNVVNPSYIALSPNGKYLYACTESKLKDNGNISAFVFDSSSGTLQFINKQPTHGDNPAYVSTSLDGTYVATATYTGGTAAIYKTNADGGLNAYSQHFDFNTLIDSTEVSHAHSAVFSPDNKYLFVPDLGMDKIHAFKFTTRKKSPLKAISKLTYEAMKGSGPRHLTFHPNSAYAYLANELSGSVTAFKYANGVLMPIQQIFAYSKELQGYATADLHVSPDGKFLYVSNRKEEENTLAIFAIDETGKLNLVGHSSTLGDRPRNFTIDPTGNFLLVANLKSKNIIVFKRNLETGELTPTGTVINIPTNPSCLQMRTYSVAE
ncbi:3-carboxymuconate cyclase [Neptunitalea sp. Y10]|uniref:3-carboxymuconate cyclase n=1 Tax=Neptunitalea lumnitzerae TaxID=2965509 RepID=A0ABQ5MEP6_9FLAO|nr:3-carboxymuconate cyclase [Neptunitalea sp. Y10]